MISGKISIAKPANEKDLLALFHRDLSRQLDFACFSVANSYFLMVWEGHAGQSLVDRIHAYSSNITLENILNELHLWPLQALLVQAHSNHNQTELIIERNHHAFCPLYFLQKGQDVYFHWDPTQLYKYLSGPDILDRSQCETFLNLRWNYGPDTVFKSIKMIPERARVIFKTDTHSIIPPQSIAPFQSQALKSGSDPVMTFQKSVMEALSWWLLEAGRTYCEQSSGLDTTLVSRLVGKVMQEPPHTFGYYPHDLQLEKIISRREEAVNIIGGMDLCPSIEHYFQYAFTDDYSLKYWPYEAPTSFEKNAIAQIISSQGGNLVFSGIGGDELCQFSEVEDITTQKTFNASNENSRFVLTSVIHDSLNKDRLPEEIVWPAGYVPQSAHDVANAIGPVYLRHNIWYAHPLSLGHLQTFAHFLPSQWRQNRRLSREILSRLGLSDCFIKQDPKESLAESLNKVLMNDAVFERLFKNSILADERLVDMDKLVKMREMFKENAKTADRASANILIAYMLERSLKSL